LVAFITHEIALHVTKGTSMGDIVKFKKTKPSEKHRGKTLCKSGFHKWVPQKSTSFDTKQGRLVTRDECKRCGAIRTRLT
jgi:hypothetical protein